MAPVFAKLAPDLHRNPKIRRAGRDARDVFVFVLCVNADRGATGSIPADYVDPWFLADALLMPEDDVRTGLDKCIEHRLLVRTADGGVQIVGWDDDEWGRARHGSMTEAERKAAQRAGKKASPTPASADVRTCPDSQAPMSGRPDMSRETETDQRQIRSEAEGEGRATAAPVAATALTLESPSTKPRQRKPRPSSPATLAPATDPEPTDRDRAFAAERGVDMAEWSAMFDHHRRRGEPSSDWSASWRTWCRNAVKFAARDAANRRPATGLAATAEILRDRAGSTFIDPFKPRGTS